jgi:hypothetical protein
MSLVQSPFSFPAFDRASRINAGVDRIASQPESGGGGDMTLPFKIVDVSPDASTPKIKVIYGTVMDILPTDVNTDLACAATTTYYLDCTISTAGNVTAAALANGASVPADSDTHAFLLVGVVTITGTVVSAIAQSLYFSQGFKACDRVVVEGAVTERGTYEFFVR